MGILCKYFVQDNFRKPEMKNMTCDLSCASVTVDVRNTQGRIYMLLLQAFVVFG